jgi:hypothetical protein
MVTQLDRLASFLNTDTVPRWLQLALQRERPDILLALERGQEYTMTGPDGEIVKIKPEAVPA